MNNIKYILIILIFVITLNISLFASSNKVLVLNSYSSGFSWSDREMEGLFSVLAQEDDIEIYVEYLDSKRFNDERHFLLFKDYIKRKYEDYEFDAVVTLDNDAFDFVLENHEELFFNTPVVYCGINYYQEYEFEKYDFIRGIVERNDIKDTIEIALKLHPNTKNVYVVLDNYTKAGQLVKKEMEETIIPMFSDINFIFITDSVEEIENNLHNPLPNSIALFLPFNRDINGYFYEYKDIGKIIEEIDILPIYTSVEDYLDYKVIGGKILKAFEQGEKAGEIVLELLNGIYMQNVPQIYFPENDYIFNYLELQRWGIPINHLPEDSIIINKPTSFYEENPILFWIIIVTLPISIVFLYILKEKNSRLKKYISELGKTKKILENKNEELRAANQQLTSFNEEIVAQNEEIEDNYKKIENLNNKIFKLLELFNKLGNEGITKEEFFYEFLKAMITQIPEADYGSVSIIEGEEWNFITAIGHDIEGLKSLPLKRKYSVWSEEAMIVENIQNENIKRMPEKLEKEMSKYTKPIKQTILKTIKVDEDIYLGMALDIKKESEKEFSEESINSFNSLLNIGKLFIINQIKTQEVEVTYNNFAQKFAVLAESHDENSKKHLTRVSELSAFVAEKFGLDDKDVERIKRFSPLHDVGKLLVSPIILNKRGKLTKEEWEEIKKHPIYSGELLEGKYFETARKIAMYHHEHYDGSGYPFGLKGNEIPIEAQIIGIVDVYDALRSKRSYKEAFSHEKAIEIILNGDERTKPEHFNPGLLSIIEKYNQEIKEIYDKFND
ncbi:HD domain-containing phosphohydrolase [Petrotoga sp. 9PW.55.5.1]|uniref:HD domain-containing phosphohydrolase n=1 Tax=Petrotoga sp. 9PW.55.5.1 TaxID=1308979 RepID=UPI000DDA0FFB|nr:HD domain-containing phosphohydrolase [Petrotoga sp. 9PW.55.5.1]